MHPTKRAITLHRSELRVSESDGLKPCHMVMAIFTHHVVVKEAERANGHENIPARAKTQNLPGRNSDGSHDLYYVVAQEPDESPNKSPYVVMGLRDHMSDVLLTPLSSLRCSRDCPQRVRGNLTKEILMGRNFFLRRKSHDSTAARPPCTASSGRPHAPLTLVG